MGDLIDEIRAELEPDATLTTLEALCRAHPEQMIRTLVDLCREQEVIDLASPAAQARLDHQASLLDGMRPIVLVMRIPEKTCLPKLS